MKIAVGIIPGGKNIPKYCISFPEMGQDIGGQKKFKIAVIFYLTNMLCDAIISGLRDERHSGSAANSTKISLKICKKHLDRWKNLCYHKPVRTSEFLYLVN